MFKANLFYGSGSVIHAMHHALHEKHDHECEIDLDGNIVQYRQSHNPRQGRFICNELDNKIISTIQSTVI